MIYSLFIHFYYFKNDIDSLFCTCVNTLVFIIETIYIQPSTPHKFAFLQVLDFLKLFLEVNIIFGV